MAMVVFQLRKLVGPQGLMAAAAKLVKRKIHIEQPSKGTPPRDAWMHYAIKCSSVSKIKMYLRSP